MNNAAFDAKLAKRSAIRRVFTPSAPILKRDAFAGRYEQITAIVDAVNEPGRHAVLYGERGVGKTSLANIIAEVLTLAGNAERQTAIRITCNAEDTYKSIWKRVFRELAVDTPEEWVYGSPNPDEVRFLLQRVDPPYIVILDEYDRVDDDEALSLMADTIKSLSDHQVGTKLVLVGVSDSIEALIGEHESVKRALEQIPMPRMSATELVQLVTSGFASLDMQISTDALVRITKLSEGLPTYAHLLSLRAGLRAIEDDQSDVTLAHVEACIPDVLDQHSNRSDYLLAVQSAKVNNLYAHVLLACALAQKDQLGFFTPAAVREPMTRIMGRPYDIPAFAKHLSSFIEPERAGVLFRVGKERAYRFRFRDPLMQPFALLNGLEKGLVPDDYKEELFRNNLDIDWDEQLRDLTKDDD